VSDSLHRIGLIVPSSNTTMETELPELFRWRSAATGERFTWHSARVSMARVTAEELNRMVEASDLAAVSLADSPVDVIAYACLVAVMCRGVGAAAEVEGRLDAALSSAPRRPPVVSSAGALVDALRALEAKRVALITPYLRPLAEQVADTVRGEGFEVTDLVALEVADNVAVGRLDPHELPAIARRIDTGAVDALVLSACVQMPSLPVVQEVEDELGLPVVTAATATARSILLALGLDLFVPGAGAALAGGEVLSAPARQP
jgi:maleate isomerase